MSNLDKIILNGTEYELSSSSGSGITTQQWDDIISLFRAALYDTTILPNPKAVIDDLEDSIDRIPATGITLSSNSLSFTRSITQTVGVTLTPTNSTDSITVSVVNPLIASASVSGRVITVAPLADGSTSIIVSTSSGLTTSIAVSVSLPVHYTVTNNLTGCTTNNSAETADEGYSYSAVLTPATDYSINSVTVMMGSTNITATAWTPGTNTIYIASVTGNISITATATTPVLYVLPQPYIANGDSDNYVNTRLMLGETNQDFSVAGYIKFDKAFPDMPNTNMQILALWDTYGQNTQFGFTVYNGSYSIGGIQTPANYNHKQNVKFVITYDSSTLTLYRIFKYFDKEDSTVENRVGDSTKTFDSFVSQVNPLMIGRRVDNYGICNYLTVQSLKVFNYVMDSTAITNFISTEEAVV